MTQHSRRVCSKLPAVPRRWASQVVLAAVAAAAWAGYGADIPVQVPTTKREPLLSTEGNLVAEGRRIIEDRESYPRAMGRVVVGSTAVRKENGVAIRFALSSYDDVLVSVVGPDGRIVRHLAHGVLGENAPEPFQKRSLAQEILWDGRDDNGRLVSLDRCRVRIQAGLQARFERFIGYDPQRIGLYVTDLETDPQGRVYVATINAPQQPVVKRFDRDGTYLETVFPPNPESLKSLANVRDVYDWDDCEGQLVPLRIGLHTNYLQGGPWSPWYRHIQLNTPEKISQWHNLSLRIRPGGSAYLLGTNPSWAPARRGKDRHCNLYRVPSLDPCWMLERMRFYSQSWTVDPQGHAYWFKEGKLTKFDLGSRKPLADFRFNGTVAYAKPQPSLGLTAKEAGRGVPGMDLGPVKDLAVDEHGNIVMINERKKGYQVFRGDGQYLGEVTEAPLGAGRVAIGSVSGIRAAGGALYVLADDPADLQTKILLKLRGKADRPHGVWTVPVSRSSRHVAVDATRKQVLVWVGNGNGLATFTRVVDRGDAPGKVTHFGAVNPFTFLMPEALALDGQDRVYTYDRARARVVRTDSNGAQWHQFDTEIKDVQAMIIDKQRGAILMDRRDHGLWSYDLELKEGKRLVSLGAGRRTIRLGGIDAQGRLYLSIYLGGQGRETYSRVDRYDGDGTLQRAGHCTLFLGGNVAVDREGSVYAMDSAQMNHASNHDARTYVRGTEQIRAGSKTNYLVRFAPGGGTRNGDGELWCHRGVSPVQGGCGRCWDQIFVTVDDHQRIYAADRDHFHVKVLDKAGNLVARIGAWGSHDHNGPASRFPTPEIGINVPCNLAATDEFLYFTDRELARVVKVRLAYRQTKEAAL